MALREVGPKYHSIESRIRNTLSFQSNSIPSGSGSATFETKGLTSANA